MARGSDGLNILKEVESSNNYAMALVKDGKARSGEGFLAMKQTGGKGRRGRKWVSEEGMNVLLTLVQDMKWMQVTDQFQLSVATALGVYDMVLEFIGINIFLKWPNDLYIDDRKAGGILIENVISGSKWQWAVIGIGLNVNQEKFDDLSLSATSIKKATGKDYELIEVAEKMKGCVERRIKELQSQNYPDMLKLYNDHLYKRNCVVKFRKGNIVFESVVKGVSPSGELLTADRNLKYDEVEWIR